MTTPGDPRGDNPFAAVEPASRTGRALIGCTFVASAFLSVFLAIGVVVGVMVSLLGSQPGQSPVALALMSGLTLAALCAFFVMISKRLYASWRGREVQHLMPPVLAVSLALALGIGGACAFFISARARSLSGMGASGMFLGYAVTSIRSWIKKRRIPH